MAIKNQCKNCNTNLEGKFCYECGQKTIMASDKTLRFLVADVFHFITHLDGKFIKTLVTLFRHPGLITKNISEGITVRYFKLTSLYLIGTLIYFLMPSWIGFGFLNNPFDAQLENGIFKDWKNSYAENLAISQHIDVDTLATIYNENLHAYGKILTIIMIPLTIPVLWLVNIGIRRIKRDHNFTAYDLGTASLEINSLLLFSIFVVGQGLVGVMHLQFPNVAIVTTVMIGIMVGTVVMFYLFFKNAYQIRWWVSIFAVIIFLMGYMLTVEIYRELTFFVFI